METKVLQYMEMDCQAGNCQVFCSCQTTWFLRIYENSKVLTPLITLGLLLCLIWKIMFYIFLKDVSLNSTACKPSHSKFYLWLCCATVVDSHEAKKPRNVINLDFLFIGVYPLIFLDL